LSQLLLGEVRFLRIPPSSGFGRCGDVVLTGIIRARDGRTRVAIALAARDRSARVQSGSRNFFSMNAFEPLFWMGCIYLSSASLTWFAYALALVRRAASESALKQTFRRCFSASAFSLRYCSHLSAGTLPESGSGSGGIIALAIALPNILWQAQHPLAHIRVLSNIAHSNKNVRLSPYKFIAQQAVFLNPEHCHSGSPACSGYFLVRVRLALPRDRITYLVTLTEFIVCMAKAIISRPRIRCSLQREAWRRARFSRTLKWNQTCVPRPIIAMGR